MDVCNRPLFSFPAKVEMAEEQEYLWCYLHVWRYDVFAGKLTWYFHWCLYNENKYAATWSFGIFCWLSQSEVWSFSFPEGALLLVSTKNREHRKSAIHGLPVTLRMFRVKFDKPDWFWSQSIVFTKPFKNEMSLDQARGRDSWCWPKGARPLGTRMKYDRTIAKLCKS